MRLLVTIDLPRQTAVPVNHQYALCSQVYSLLRTADPDYARFLHDEGYGGATDARRYKLFCFSGLRSPRRRVEGETLWLGPGRVTWQVGSPCASFLQNFATGLLGLGALTVGAVTLPVASVEALQSPDFPAGRARFTCLTPIVVSLSGPESAKRYVRPWEQEEFSGAVRNNLLNKYRAWHRCELEPEEAQFSIRFDEEYLSRDRHRGTKKITFKGIEVIGAQAPCDVTTSPALLQLLYDAGAGELNSGGFGMVEISR